MQSRVHIAGICVKNTHQLQPVTLQCHRDDAPKQGVKRKAARKPRPKVTIEDLKKKSGLEHLVDAFPTQFRTVFRGPGHEVTISCCRMINDNPNKETRLSG